MTNTNSEIFSGNQQDNLSDAAGKKKKKEYTVNFFLLFLVPNKRR